MNKSAIFRYKSNPNDKIVGLKEGQKELLNILNKFHSFCVDYGIQYSLAYGSLLGAIREKGIIPWDDDIDLMMTYDNYIKLKNNLKYLSNYKIDSISFENTKRMYTNEIRIIDKNIYRIVSDNKHDYLTPLCIDIFPLRIITKESNNKIEKHLKTIEKCKQHLILKDSKYKSKNLFRYYVRMIKKICLCFESKNYLHHKIEKLLNEIELLSNKKECSYFSPYSSSFMKKYELKWFKNYLIVDFNNVKAMVSSESKTILDMIYPGWETPVDRYQGRSNFFKFVIRK